MRAIGEGVANNLAARRLKEFIDKQERDKEGIEKRVSQSYGKQIQEFEEAIMSIEEQKMGIYGKLNEAMHVHNQVHLLIYLKTLNIPGFRAKSDAKGGSKQQTPPES